MNVTHIEGEKMSSGRQSDGEDMTEDEYSL